MPTKANKTCAICCEEVGKLSISPATCSKGHSPNQRACRECWEAYLSKEVEEKAPEAIRCMFCPTHPGANNILDEKEVKRLAWAGTVERCNEKLQESSSYRCGQRCWASKRDTRERHSPSVQQPHSREIDGRVFTCKFCAFATCADCDHPDHPSETCTQYRARVLTDPAHVAAEAATAARFKQCPNCQTCWEWHPENNKSCTATTCEACKFRFCGDCLVNWVGDGSAYLLGRMAHKEECRYRKEEKSESRHGLRGRFPVVKKNGEVEGRGGKVKKRKGDVEDEEGGGSAVKGGGEKQDPGKKKKVDGKKDEVGRGLGKVKGGKRAKKV